MLLVAGEMTKSSVRWKGAARHVEEIPADRTSIRQLFLPLALRMLALFSGLQHVSIHRAIRRLS